MDRKPVLSKNTDWQVFARRVSAAESVRYREEKLSVAVATDHANI